MFRSALFCAALLAGAPFVTAQQAASSPSVPLPAPLLSAQKVFLANGGAEPVLANYFRSAGLADEPYASLYGALRTWGRWQMESSPDGADLILVVDAAATAGVYNNGVPSYDLHLDVRILDGKTHLPLWTVNQPLEGAYRKATFAKNYQDAIAGLITQLKGLTLPGAQTP